MGAKRRKILVARALLVRDGRLLVCRAAEGYGYLPGGKIEFGEPARDALRREIEEETGVAIRVGDLCLVTEGRFRQEREYHELNLVFHVELEEPDADVASLEPDIAFEWLDLDQIARIDLRPPAIKAWLVARRGSDGTPPPPTAAFVPMSSPSPTDPKDGPAMDR